MGDSNHCQFNTYNWLHVVAMLCVRDPQGMRKGTLTYLGPLVPVSDSALIFWTWIVSWNKLRTTLVYDDLFHTIEKFHKSRKDVKTNIVLGSNMVSETKRVVSLSLSTNCTGVRVWACLELLQCRMAVMSDALNEIKSASRDL